MVQLAPIRLALATLGMAALFAPVCRHGNRAYPGKEGPYGPCQAGDVVCAAMLLLLSPFGKGA